MVCEIKGDFVESGQFTRKTGAVVPYVRVITADGSVVQITDFIAPPTIKKYEPLSVKCKVRSTKFGLMVSAYKA